MKRLLALTVFTLSSSWALAVTPFSLPWMNGTGNYNSSDHPNTVFVVENYFLDCPYCNDNAPNIDQIASDFSTNARVQVLDVGIDKDDASYREWIQRHNPNHPVLKDAQETLTRQLGTTGYPSTYVLDTNLNVVYSHTGEFEQGDLNAVEQAVNNVLNQSFKALPAPSCR